MKKAVRNQLIALPLTAITCAAMIGLVVGEVVIINHFSSQKIAIRWQIADILIGLTVYLKTSIDFAMFIGRLMSHNQGLKGRIAIEVGTALGNAVGTMAVLLLWAGFKEVHWLLAIMIVVAALVLLRLAEDGLEHILEVKHHYPSWLGKFVSGFERSLVTINRPFKPLLGKLLPSTSLSSGHRATFWALLAMAFTVPFILGLDDFAGYVPLFNVVNVVGFASGVFIGHMILNIFLYLSPKRTIAAVKNPLISLAGSLAFVILAGWGLIEASKLLLH
ncbi:MAG: hypothetical protein ABI221_03480 [Candidatus Saccharimonadales bacterium]